MAVSRFQAEQGQTVRLRVQFKNPGGALYDPSSIAQVVITRDDGTVLDTVVAGWVHEGIGIYYLDWAIPAAETLGLHYDTWTYTSVLGGTATTGSAEFYVYAAGTFAAASAYLSVAKVKADCLTAAASWPAGLYPTDGRILEAVNYATEIIDGASKRSFIPQDLTLTLDGSGKPYQFFEKDGHLYKAIRVDSITIDGDPVDMTQVVVGPFSVVDRYWRPETLMDECGDSGCSCRVGCGGENGAWGVCFTAGRANVVVTGLFGDYNIVPYTIQDACCRIVHNILEEEWGAWQPFVSESLGGWSYTMRTIAAQAEATGSTGWSDIDAMLRRPAKKRVRIGRL